MIAMTLLRRPLLRICDEPTTALDPTVQREILLLLKDLQAKYGMGLLFISHDLGVVQHLSQQLHVLRKGETVEKGKTEEVFHRPKEDYTRALIHSRPSMYPDADRLPSPDDLQTSNWRAKPRITSLKEVSSLFEVQNLSFTYPAASKPVLKGVGFSLAKGQALGLVGESGSGKSTIGRLVCGLLSGHTGQMSLEGKPLNTTRSRDERRRIQMVFQDPFASLNPRYTVYRTISEAIRFHGIESQKARLKDRVVDILVRTGLEAGMMDRYPHEFSGGQRQRIVMARALVLRPDILICDESVAALDVSVQSRILNLLKDLQDEFGFSCHFM
jgi:peptide/nickel transport system ATP-binding protein